LLVAVHAYGMFFFWHLFPFDSSFTILIVTVIETIVVGLVYIRTCQSIDPEGPFGPTDAEKHAHKSRPRIWCKTVFRAICQTATCWATLIR
jgi:hypothetical protein